MKPLASAAWKFNANAVGAMFGLTVIALAPELRGMILGLAICMLFCTTQICHALQQR